MTLSVPQLNSEDRPLFDAARWRRLDQALRRSHIDAAIRALSPGGAALARVVAIDQEFRVSVQFQQQLAPLQEQEFISALESECRAHLDPRIELFLTAKPDRNRLRQGLLEKSEGTQ